MRTRHHAIALCTTLGASVALSAGCSHYYDDYYLPLTNPLLARDAGSDSGNPTCSGDPSPMNVTDACGVFAQANAPAGGDGSMAKPFSALGAAITAAEAAGKRVYACTSAPFNEAVSISAGVEVYGGLDCTKGWTWSQAARTQLDGPADTIALTITTNATGAKVEGFAITAPSPSSMTMGGSSIAVAVADVAAALEQCDVTASDAADGVEGQPPTGSATQGTGAPAPIAGTENACSLPGVVAGGTAGVTMCGSTETSGGPGGKGGIPITAGDGGSSDSSGAQGGNGIPLPSPNPTMSGLGGVGQTDPTDPTKACQDGTKGLGGTVGTAGPGGAAMGTGDVLSLSGLVNNETTDGQLGAPGQGGGGGGGAMSGTFCGSSANPGDGPGASGGGGGAGGCGGAGGGGGMAGGSSIAIVSLGTSLALTSVTLTVGKGGTGGNGTVGQAGGAYGNGANGGASSGLAGSNAGCQGGNGGAGGSGGPGGGGRGGHAIGIAYVKAPVTVPMVATFTPGSAGNGGKAGSGAPMSSNGGNGAAGQCWDFTTHAACAM